MKVNVFLKYKSAGRNQAQLDLIEKVLCVIAESLHVIGKIPGHSLCLHIRPPTLQLNHSPATTHLYCVNPFFKSCKPATKL